MTRTLAGHFANSMEAQAAIDQLERQGFTKDQVSYLAHDGSGRLANAAPERVESDSNTAKGAALGGVSGLLLGLASLAIPGIGPIVAAGPIAAALAGGAVGAATGGLLGALGDLGLPENDAKHWADLMQSAGGALVLVRVDEENTGPARNILVDHGASDVRLHDAKIGESGPDVSLAHADHANFGDEGGSSQWGQTVLRADSKKPAERTFSRDRSSKQLD